MPSEYLSRLDQRRKREAARRRIAFGLVGGWLLLLVGAFRWAYRADASPLMARSALIAGAVLFACGLLRPSVLGPAEAGLRIATGWIGRALFSALLVVAYFAIITPVGLCLRARSGSAPFHAWDDGGEGWTPKQEGGGEPSHGSRVGRPLLIQLFAVVAHFIRIGRWILVPSLVLLLILGLALFFVKGSALAPFIYTLF
jgi:hypothetical protein